MADGLILKLEKVKQAGFGYKNRKDIEETRRREKGKNTTEDLRKEIPLDWRETFGNRYLEGFFTP
ncbi:hypothetical protein DRN85_08985, partial [Methanosarcinales archaeon]